MRVLWLGLTDLYNLFHDPSLTPELVTKSLGDRATITGDEGFARIQRLRELHRELDQTVLTAYGWHTDSDFGPALALRHDFHPLDFLPENDRIRLTLHPEARREVLARLLKLNHQRAAQAEQVQQQAVIVAPKRRSKPKQPAAVASPELNLPLDLFGRAVTIPTPTWMDRPLVLPISRRVVLTPDRYRATLVPHLLYQAGGSIPFDRFRKAYWLLTEPGTLKRYATGAIGTVALEWGRTFKDTLQKDRFIEHLKGAVGRQLHFIRKSGERWLELRDENVADDEHVIFDARLALLVADLWLAAEPIAPLGPADEIAIRELEAVL
jgi:hypothetical protein